MTTLNPLYVSSTPLQWLFRNKDDGSPLAGGIIESFIQGTSVHKPMYQLDNSSPTGFSVLNNPITLTSIGSFADNNGNDIIPYFYPFDANGNPELYEIFVYDANGVLQFSRQDWPPNEEGGNIAPSDENKIVNYVANGQFLLHNDHPITATITTLGTDTVSYIAQGGWTFEKESTSTSTDTVTFVREESSSTQPNVDANPRYFFQLATGGVDTNYARKDLCLTFPDVNKFAGDPANLASNYTFSFQGLCVSGGEPTVEFILRKFFGTGGSATTEVVLGTIKISSVENIYNFTFTFGDNSGKQVGTTLDDDYLQLCLRFPNSAQTVKLTDFVLTPGSNAVIAFPQTANSEFLVDSTIGYLPGFLADGSDLYVPLEVTDLGATYDFSRVGQVVSAFYTAAYAAAFPLLLCDGSIYIGSNYSALGIPYSRLGSVLIANSNTVNTPLFGTGGNYITASTSATVLTLVINGGAPASPPTIGTTTFVLGGGGATFTLTPGGLPTASQYFTFQTTEGTPRNFYVWYQISNSVDPAPAGKTGIKVSLTGSETVAQMLTKTVQAINAYQFVVPDLRGFFLRGQGGNSAALGVSQSDMIAAHTHSLPNVIGIGAGHTELGTTVNNIEATATGSFGGVETRPVNFAVNYFIYM